MIKASHIFHQFGSKVVLEDISFSVETPSLIAIIGPNGGGKSTLIKILGGFLESTSGSVESQGSIAYLPQQSELDRLFPITVEETLKMALWKQEKEKAPLVHSVLDKVGLWDLKDNLLSELSGGQLQRALFARLLLQEAKILLLDEPFSAVDPQTIEVLMGVLIELQSQGVLILVVIHHLQIVKDFFPQALLLNKSLVKFGKTDNVLPLYLSQERDFEGI